MLDLVGNPEDRFSQNEALMPTKVEISLKKRFCILISNFVVRCLDSIKHLVFSRKNNACPRNQTEGNEQNIVVFCFTTL